VRDDVVDCEQAARCEHAHEVAPVAGVGAPLGVQEYEVPGAVGTRGKDRPGVIDDELDDLIQACDPQVLACQAGAGAVDLDAGERAVHPASRVGEPDRRVPVGRAQLQQLFGRERSDQHPQQACGVGLDVARHRSGRSACRSSCSRPRYRPSRNSARCVSMRVQPLSPSPGGSNRRSSPGARQGSRRSRLSGARRRATRRLDARGGTCAFTDSSGEVLVLREFIDCGNLPWLAAMVSTGALLLARVRANPQIG
jgi:hypothetical protein